MSPGESHLQQGHDESAVADVVAGHDGTAPDQVLHRLEDGLQSGGVLDIGSLIAQLGKHLREGASPQTMLVAHAEQPQLVALPLEVGGHPHADVGHQGVGGEHQLGRRLDQLAAALGAQRLAGHGQAVLASVDSHAELGEDVTQRAGRVVEPGSLAGLPHGQHPVGRALDVADVGDDDPGHVQERLCSSHAHAGSRADEPLDGLLAQAERGARRVVVGLSDQGIVGEGQVARTDQLPLDDEPGDVEVHLAGEEALGGDGRKAQDEVEHTAKVGGRREDQRLEICARRAPRGAARELELLGRQLPQDIVQGQVHRPTGVGGVVEDQYPVARHPTHDGQGHVLALGDGLQYRQVGRPDEEGVPLLRLVPPYLQHRQRLVADGDGPQIDHRPCRFDDLGEGVAVAAGPQVVGRDYGVVLPQLHAGPHEAVDALPHLRVSALDGVEVELLDVLPLLHAARGPAAHADAIGRPAHLDHQHVLLRRALDRLPVPDLARPHAVHDGLVPGAIAVRQPQPEAAGEAVDERFAKAVAVVRGPVAGLDEDLDGGRQIGGMGVAVILPGQLVAGDVQVARAVGRAGSVHEPAPPHSLIVADAPSPAGGRARIGSHARGEVVRLGRQRGMQEHRRRQKPRGSQRLGGRQHLYTRALDGRAVVAEGDDRVGSRGCEWLPDDVHEVLLGYALAVHPQLALEHPVAGVLGVGLRDLEELHVGGVASQTPEDVRDEIQVARVPTAPMTPVELTQGFYAQFEERDDLYRSRDETGLEGR